MTTNRMTGRQLPDPGGGSRPLERVRRLRQALDRTVDQAELDARLAWWELGRWRWQRRVVAAAVAVLAAVVIAVPTGIITTPLYTRMTPVLWWNYPVWITTAIVEGLLAATYLPPGTTKHPVPIFAPQAPGRALGGGVVAFLAVGCPICNKLVVALLGVSGALTFFAPLQPVLAGLALGVLIVGLRLRLRPTMCALPGTESGAR